MRTVEIIPLQQPVHKQIAITASLSYTIRALNIAAMTKGSVTILNPLYSDDTEAMMNALETLGIEIEKLPNAVIIKGSIFDVKDGNYEIDINISGRVARTLLGLLCIVPGTKILTCQPSFKKRPVGELVLGLQQLGATIEYLEKENYLPVKISSSTLQPGVVKMKGNISSQFFSSILMIAPIIGDITIEVDGEQTSKSFIDVTIETMNAFGVTVENNNYQAYSVKTGQQYKATEFTVEADAIAAGYFWGIAAVTGSTIEVLHLPATTKQGDAAFADVLEKMGCTVTKNKNSITVAGPQKLKAVDINMNSMPDSAQTLAVVAAFAEGKTNITGLDNARIKETDRIHAPQTELKKMSIEVESTQTSLSVTGGTAHAATIETYNDHRVAMSFAIAGTKIPGIKIENPSVVSKSFPAFWDTIEELGVTINYL